MTPSSPRSSPAGRGEQLETLITAVDAAALISKVTGAVNEELAAWRNWPLDRICPVQARSGGRLCPARASSGGAPVMRDPVTRHVQCPAMLARVATRCCCVCVTAS
jgi:hypothetical protein